MYKHFKAGVITQDADTGYFTGTIDNISDYVSFGGENLIELEKDFQRAVDDYIITCKEVGK